MEKILDTNDEWITTRTGVRERRIAKKEEATSHLALRAAQNALDNAGVKAEEIDLIIMATLTSDRIIPSTACILQHELGAKKAAAFDLSAACSGFVYSLDVANQFIKAGTYEKILVIGGETLSKFVDYEDRSTAILFGDGAGAAVVGRVEEGYGFLAFDVGSDGSGGDYINIPSSGSRSPVSAETIASRDNLIHMDGKETFKFAVKIMGHSTLEALKKIGETEEILDWLVPHQANIRIIEAAAKRVNLPMEKVIVNIDKYGNTSAGTIPIALAEAHEAKLFKKGDIIALSGFGAGLTWGSAIIKWSIA